MALLNLTLLLGHDITGLWVMGWGSQAMASGHWGGALVQPRIMATGRGGSVAIAHDGFWPLGHLVEYLPKKFDCPGGLMHAQTGLAVNGVNLRLLANASTTGYSRKVLLGPLGKSYWLADDDGELVSMPPLSLSRACFFLRAGPSLAAAGHFHSATAKTSGRVLMATASGRCPWVPQRIVDLTNEFVWLSPCGGFR